MRIYELIAAEPIARADAEILIAHVLRQPRSWVFAHPEAEIPEHDAMLCRALFQRRRTGEPVAYILGEKEFFSRTFLVDRSVLIPRPATEGLVDLVLGMYKKSIQLEAQRWHKLPIDEGIVAAVFLRGEIALPPFIIEIGTGSGCIAITLACELLEVHVLATDISANAIEIARSNAQRNHATNRIRFALADGTDILREMTEPFFIIANPPYIPQGMELETDVQNFEPHTALFGGDDGADMVRQLANAAVANPLCAGIAMECRTEQIA